MEYKDCDSYHPIPNACGWCVLNESQCLVEAYNDDCTEIEEPETDLKGLIFDQAENMLAEIRKDNWNG